MNEKLTTMSLVSSIEEYYKEKVAALEEKVDTLEHKLATEHVPSTDVGEEAKAVKPTLKGGKFGARKSIVSLF